MGATCLPDMLKIYTGIDWDLNTIKLHNFFKIDKINEKMFMYAQKYLRVKKTGYMKKIMTGKCPKNSKVKFN